MATSIDEQRNRITNYVDERGEAEHLAPLRRQLALALLDHFVALEISDTELAERVGQNRVEISKLRNGKLDKFSVDRLIRIAEKAGLNVKVNFLGVAA
ncbi:XRE family transcriptional regulator [Nocardia terpenica]|uniref:HigA2-like helix-turn-helix domain-containing protein n=1 Tax=Nocardia terpenica TaxID=455432 RepID=A0A164K636_9NOCA|nr:XRE family transcriptional regulator [Nocardia terpenica]KZM71074.1 hypothetical protein AWN90_41930 [Nocardia terpenica]NQE89603.1 XRE family transcriptional regulator [Nocardia terpenica]